MAKCKWGPAYYHTTGIAAAAAAGQPLIWLWGTINCSQDDDDSINKMETIDHDPFFQNGLMAPPSIPFFPSSPKLSKVDGVLDKLLGNELCGDEWRFRWLGNSDSVRIFSPTNLNCFYYKPHPW